VKMKNEKSWFTNKDPLDPKLQAEYRRDYLNEKEQEPAQPPVQPPESQLSNFSEEHLNAILTDGSEDEKLEVQQELQRRKLQASNGPRRGLSGGGFETLGINPDMLRR